MSAALLAKLIEAGTPADLIAEVAMELGRAQAAVEVLEARKAKDRQRKRSTEIHGTPRKSEEAAESAEIPSPLTPPLKNTPDPKKYTPPISPQPPKNDCARASRLPADWKPQVLTGKAAEMVACWQAGEVERELAKFKNYWFSKGGKDAVKVNWQRTWINWLISADERKPRNYERSDRDPTTVALERLIGSNVGAHAGTG